MKSMSRNQNCRRSRTRFRFEPWSNFSGSKVRSRRSRIVLSPGRHRTRCFCCCRKRQEKAKPGRGKRIIFSYLDYAEIFATTPAPTVRPPSRMAKRVPSSKAIGAPKITFIVMSSPGITISTPAGNSISPVTSVVRM